MAKGNGWREMKVQELQDAGVLLVEDGNHGEYRPRPAEFSDTGVAFIRAADMDNGRVLFGKASKINATARERIRKGIGAPGDVLLSHKGTVGKVALVPQDAPAFVCSPQTTFWRSLDPGELDRGFLFAYLKSASFQGQLAALKGETDMADYVSLTTQRGLRVPLPPIQTQRAVAAVLGALDDKIELNRRMNGTLEAMARALFKSWFVDFDPVRAKAEGRAPAGMDAATAALFPDALEGYELGAIPRGWAFTPVLDIADLISGGTPKTTVLEYWGGGIKWASAKDVSQCGTFFLLDTERTVTALGVENSSTKVLPADCVVVVARGATCGRFAVLAEPMAMNQTCYALRAKDRTARWYLRFQAEGLLQRLVAQAHGSVFDTITTSTFELARVVVPAPQVLAAFEAAVDPLLEQIRSSQRESVTLAALRDALLPKLLSGELRIRDAERTVGQMT